MSNKEFPSILGREEREIIHLEEEVKRLHKSNEELKKINEHLAKLLVESRRDQFKSESTTTRLPLKVVGLKAQK